MSLVLENCLSNFLKKEKHVLIDIQEFFHQILVTARNSKM